MGGCCESRQLELTNNKYVSTESTNFSHQSQFRRTYLHAVLSGIQEESRRNREERLKFCATHFNDSTYINLVEKSIEKERVRISELVKSLTTQFGSLELIEKELYSDIVSYLELRGIGEKEVKNWIAEKAKIVKLHGKQLSSQLKSFVRGVNQNISKVQIFQTMIEDKCSTDKGFLLSVASQFIYQNQMRQKDQWIGSLSEIQKELDFITA